MPTPERRFHVLGAVGHERPGGPQRIALLEPAPRKSLAEWKAFLGRLEGAPEIVVSDMDSAIARAVVELFPTAEHRWSEFHLKRSVANALPERVLADAAHPVTKALEFALTAVLNYRAFERAVREAAVSRSDFMGTLKWLDRHGPRIVAQASTRTLTSPNSTGGCEAALGQISRRLADRTGRMTNRARLRRLLASWPLRSTALQTSRPGPNASKKPCSPRVVAPRHSGTTTTRAATRGCSDRRREARPRRPLGAPRSALPPALAPPHGRTDELSL